MTIFSRRTEIICELRTIDLNLGRDLRLGTTEIGDKTMKCFIIH